MFVGSKPKLNLRFCLRGRACGRWEVGGKSVCRWVMANNCK